MSEKREISIDFWDKLWIALLLFWSIKLISMPLWNIAWWLKQIAEAMSK